MTDDNPEAPAGRVERDTAAARTLITPALLAEVGRRLYEYENAIDWNTSCLGCAAKLDQDYALTMRAEQAEALLVAIAEHRNAACAALRIAETQARYPAGDEVTAERYRAAREALEGAGTQERSDEKGPTP